MAEEVTPEFIETDLKPLSGADEWLARMREKVAKTAASHHAYDIEDAEALAQARRERAAVRRDIAEVDNERKALTRVIDDAVKRFRNDTKDILKPLTDLDNGYKAKIDEYADRVAKMRRQELEDFYREMAPLMAVPSDDGRALVPFDALVKRYGMGQKGKKWLLQSTNIVEAKNELTEALREIQEYEAVISHSVAPDDVDVARAVYFDTLDMAKALAEADNRKRQRARLEALEQERREIEQWEAEQADAARAEREERVPEPVMPDEPAPEPTPAPRPAPEPTPAPVPEQWVFAGYGTAEQADMFVRWCDEHGVGRKVAIPTNGRDYRLAVR